MLIAAQLRLDRGNSEDAQLAHPKCGTQGVVDVAGMAEGKIRKLLKVLNMSNFVSIMKNRKMLMLLMPALMQLFRGVAMPVCDK